MLHTRLSSATARLLVACYCLSAYPGALLHAQESLSLPTVNLLVGGHGIVAEVASSHMTRTKGLMHRHYLAPQQGMLFVYNSSQKLCMWMKNTLLPLSVAFLDEDGRIVNIAMMHPHDETPHCSNGRALYALEMNQGWFAARKVAAGDIISGVALAVKR